MPNILQAISDLEEVTEPEEIFDFSSPESVLIEIVEDSNGTRGVWRNYTIESATVIHFQNLNVTGAASYEDSYGGFLDYVIMDLVDPPGVGWFVVENITGVYTRGDGYTSDDDMSFSCTGIRPATAEEIALA